MRLFTTLSPWAKLAIWALAVIGISAAIQAGTTMLGIDFNIFSHSAGRSVVLIDALFREAAHAGVELVSAAPA